MTETDFNNKITREFKKLGTEYYAFKTADKVKKGLPDWLWFHKGRAIAVESKYTKVVASRGALLRHPLVAEQRTYFDILARAGVPGWVVIGEEDSGDITAIEYTKLLKALAEHDIDEKHHDELEVLQGFTIRGNMPIRSFEKLKERGSDCLCIKVFSKSSIRPMIDHIVEISLQNNI